MLDMFWVFVIFAGCLGAIFGSFITALTHRARTGEAMHQGRSVCPHCRHELQAIDLFPVASYLLLRGRCRYCRQPISIQYFCIEVTTALLFIFGFTHIWRQAEATSLPIFDPMGLLWLCVGLVMMWTVLTLLIALFVYDLRWSQLPNQWTLLLAVVGLGGAVLAAILQQPLLWLPEVPPDTWDGLRQAILSGLTAGVFFYAIVIGSEVVLKKPGMGMGDVKLAVGLGLVLGFPGIVVGLYLAFIFGAMLSLVLIAGKRKSFGQQIPFGPFMVIGAVAAIELTPAIVNWYTKFLW